MKGQISKPERANSRPERADFRHEKADFRPERADFRPERAWGEKQMDGRTNKQKYPVFYRTSPPLGPLPKSVFHHFSTRSLWTNNHRRLTDPLMGTSLYLNDNNQ